MGAGLINILARLRSLLRRRRVEDETRAEVEAHLDLLAHRYRRSGLTPAEAWAAARRQFGNATLIREEVHRMHGFPWLDEAAQDLRYAARSLRRSPGFTSAAVLTLALGIGANTTVFTVVNAVLLRGLPFDDADRIMALGTRDARGRIRGVSLQDFEDWQPAARSFSRLCVVLSVPMNFSDGGAAPEQYFGPYVSGTLFEIIGQGTVLGRTFRPDDELPSASPVIILSHRVWRDRYALSPAVLGRAVKFNGLVATVIGVMPEGMKFPANGDLWVLMSQLPPPYRATNTGRGIRDLSAFGRLADGVSIEQAAAEMATIGTRLSRDYPDTNKDMVPTVEPYHESASRGALRLLFQSLMGAVAFVLLIACANVANLLLVRAAHRCREIGVRASLGATQWRLVRQLLAESLLLSALGGACGLGLSLVGIRLVDLGMRDVNRPYWMTFTLDPLVFAFLAAVCVGVGLLLGVAPALHLLRTDVNALLKEGGRSAGNVRSSRWSGALVAAELALTLVLLAGAGFMMRSFLVLYQTDVGIDTSRLVALQLALPSRTYRTADERTAFITRLDERLSTVTTVEAAAAVSHFPAWGGARRQLLLDGRGGGPGDDLPMVTMVATGRRYFDTIGLRIMQGRAFTEDDRRPARGGAIVNQRFVDVHFAGETVLGSRVRLMEGRQGPRTEWLTLVGVVPNVRQAANWEDLQADPIVYVPLEADPNPIRGTNLLLRGRPDVGAMTRVVQAELRTLDPDLAVYGVRTMDQLLGQQRWAFRMFGSMFGIFAVIALTLSAIGLYGVTAYVVKQRTHEIGVRVALGARGLDVCWLVVRRALVQLAIGLGIGLAGAAGVGRLLQSFLIRTTAWDPVTLVTIALILMLVALLACLIPARRAARLRPTAALRTE